MTPEEIASELIRVREESSRLAAREEELRSLLETELAESPEKRLSVADHEFVYVPPGTSSQLNEDLLRDALRSRGLTDLEIAGILQSATKTSPRGGYLRITPPTRRVE